eukprot:TRINITY_DN26133_c0_g1_i1.p1 TRINITY_DN26133_c0_g1~~TRINITY_DN26133_c0_g1_i1.p1  ORF type:complete len:635 (-),score=127.74 TRINITY_DN26133_c0_g1_i1:49-1953(-)
MQFQAQDSLMAATPADGRASSRGRSRRLRTTTTVLVLSASAVWLSLAALQNAGGSLAFGGRRAKTEEPPVPPRRLQSSLAYAALAAAGLAGAGFLVYQRHRVLRSRQLQRPYTLPDVGKNSPVLTQVDAEEQLQKIVTFLQDEIMRPIDDRLPGHPFEYDMHSFPFTPMVLIIGNHSSGKSTFVNKLLGQEVQQTGVAPTDDGFTILERRTASDHEDGPTVLGCPENRPYAELQRFGQIFSGHLRRKRLVLPQTSVMPYGLQIVDTPGMIDLPVNAESMNESRGRGYNFVEVVRWWAKRSDLILLLFDPDKPGTTGETLDVLTKSLSGLNHKFLVILNKVDKLDNSIDFARAYGALGWALSKVIKRKDIPQVYTMYNEGLQAPPGHHSLPLEKFAKKREEVVEEVLRVRERHNDNIITSLEDTLRQMDMVAVLIRLLRSRARKWFFQLQVFGLLSILLPALVVTYLWRIVCSSLAETAAAEAAAAASSRRSGSWGFRASAAAATGEEPEGSCLQLTTSVYLGVFGFYALFCGGVIKFLVEYLLQYQRELFVNLDASFEEAYAEHFIHDDGEDLRSRWLVVKPKVAAILQAVNFYPALPSVAPWELIRIKEAVQKDVWYLRQLARQLRQPNASRQ